MYNFQVRDLHTYFVGDSAETAVLVHNDECTDGHHIAVQSLGYGKDGAAGLFLNSESARIANPFYVTHNGKYLWSVSHPQYTDAVVNLYNTWAVKNGMKTIRSMSNEQAMLFLQAIEGSRNPTIRDYLRGRASTILCIRCRRLR